MAEPGPSARPCTRRLARAVPGNRPGGTPRRAPSKRSPPVDARLRAAGDCAASAAGGWLARRRRGRAFDSLIGADSEQREAADGRPAAQDDARAALAAADSRDGATAPAPSRSPRSKAAAEAAPKRRQRVDKVAAPSGRPALPGPSRRAGPAEMESPSGTRRAAALPPPAPAPVPPPPPPPPPREPAPPPPRPESRGAAAARRPDDVLQGRHVAAAPVGTVGARPRRRRSRPLRRRRGPAARRPPPPPRRRRRRSPACRRLARRSPPLTGRRDVGVFGDNDDGEGDAWWRRVGGISGGQDGGTAGGAARMQARAGGDTIIGGGACRRVSPHRLLSRAGSATPPNHRAPSVLGV